MQIIFEVFECVLSEVRKGCSPSLQLRIDRGDNRFVELEDKQVQGLHEQVTLDGRRHDVKNKK